MTNSLQNRLVGTIIVVALVVIFVPEFLDGKKRVNQQGFVDVPPASELVEIKPIEPFDASKAEQALMQSVELVDETPVDVDAINEGEEKNSIKQSNKASANSTSELIAVQPTSKQEATSESRQPSKPTVKTVEKPTKIEIKDSGWVVQLGSFQHEKNVRELMKTLKSAGYRAYTRPVMTTGGELTKVFVGPELDREKLELALPHLQKITQLKGKITAFEVSAG